MSKRKCWERFEKKVANKRQGKGGKKDRIPNQIMVQRMTSEPNHLKRYEVVETREFVDFEFDELTIENIKVACEKFFDMPIGSCDILLSDRGPSCFLTEQISGKKLYYVRFIDNRASIRQGDKNKNIFDENHVQGSSNPSLTMSITKDSVSVIRSSLPSIDLKDRKNFSSGKAQDSLKPTINASISVLDLLKARKLIEPPDTEDWTIQAERFSVADNAWKEVKQMKLRKEKNSFAEGGFRLAFKAKLYETQQEMVVKIIKTQKINEISELGFTIKQHTRKQVQMHSVAKHISQKLTKSAPIEFGSTFEYGDVFFGMHGDLPITIEKYIPGDFVKICNNDGTINTTVGDDELVQKAECLMHFSYVVTDNKLMLVDSQGVNYALCDPGIATSLLSEDGELNFCAGNLSDVAISTFMKNHTCNAYCKLLGL